MSPPVTRDSKRLGIVETTDKRFNLGSKTCPTTLFIVHELDSIAMTTTPSDILAPGTHNTRGPVPNSYLSLSLPECRLHVLRQPSIHANSKRVKISARTTMAAFFCLT